MAVHQVHWTTFPAVLVPGTKVIVRGTPHEMLHFTVDFLAEAGEYSLAKPIALHFDVRFDYLRGKHYYFRDRNYYIAMNTRDDCEEWSPDRVYSDVCPFQINVPFELVFQVDEEQFTVFVDGIPTHGFPHRMDYRIIRQVRVVGSLTIHGVEFVQ